MRFKVETVTSSKLKGTTWEDVDVGDIAMISISYGRTVSHLQFLYVKDGKFSPSVRHGDLIENLEIVSFTFICFVSCLLYCRIYFSKNVSMVCRKQSFYLREVGIKFAYPMAHIMGFT
ncbi:hypothetical protein KY285_000123 [Solanum tuberosum]|nr:hypothetical protein KY284_000133 [Solanum tuberosum]KAH0764252.1 hypothetical protein KY285_000123 [Solanum tuberosum]